MTTAIVRPARANLGFDTDQRLAYAQAKPLRDLGYGFVLRYGPLPGNDPSSDLTALELEMYLDLGMEVSIIQHPRRPGWDPGAHSGADDAAHLLDYARMVGIPEGSHLYLDLEGIRIGTTPQIVTIFAESWAATTLAARFKAALYLGYQVPLDAVGAWLLRGIDSYMSDAGPRAVAKRGFARKQLQMNIMVAGILIDRDESGPDLLGDVPMVAVANVGSVGA